MAKIDKVEALEVLDSKSNPTIEVKVYTTDGYIGWAAVPSGASTGVTATAAAGATSRRG